MVKNKSVFDFSDLLVKEKNLIDHLSPDHKIKELIKGPSIFQINKNY